MKKLILGLLVVVVLGGAVALVYRLASEGVVIEVTQEQLQRQLDGQFPLEKSVLLLRVELSNPRVALQEGSERIHFGVDVTAFLPAQKPISGAGEISGGVRYAPETGQFFLQNSTIEQLAIPGIPENYRPQLQEIVTLISREYLERHPIYQIQAADFKEAVAKSLLQSVKVEDGKLKIRLGFTSME